VGESVGAAVIAGLDPAIHQLKNFYEAGWMRGSSLRMTM
jgi:hypothetical protein